MNMRASFFNARHSFPRPGRAVAGFRSLTTKREAGGGLVTGGAEESGNSEEEDEDGADEGAVSGSEEVKLNGVLGAVSLARRGACIADNERDEDPVANTSRSLVMLSSSLIIRVGLSAPSPEPEDIGAVAVDLVLAMNGDEDGSGESTLRLEG